MRPSPSWFVFAAVFAVLAITGPAGATILYSSAGPFTTEDTNSTGATTLDTGQTFNSSIIYLGFDAVRNSPTGSAVNSFAGLELGSTSTNDGADGQFALGNRWTEDDWGWFVNAGAEGDFSPATAVGNSTHRIVAKLDFSGTVLMFLDPTDLLEGNNTSTNTGQAPNTFGFLHLRSGNAGINYTWSNIVISDDFAEAAAIPEPSSLVLVVVGLLSLVFCRRWKRLQI